MAFLDESVLGSRNPAFADWPRLPLQTELFGHQNAGEIVFDDIQKLLGRNESHELADVLEVYYLCLLLGFKGRYAAGGDLHSVKTAVRDKIRRVRAGSPILSPRGLLPSDAVRVLQSDPWLRKLAVAAIAGFILAYEAARCSRRVASLTLQVIAPAPEIEPDDRVLGTMALRLGFIAERRKNLRHRALWRT